MKEVNNHFICQSLGKNWTKGANWGQSVIDFLDFLILKEEEGCLKVKKKKKKDFPGGPEVQTPHSQCRGPGFDPRSGS